MKNDPDRLARIAGELVTRIHDEDPRANGRWLAAELPDPADWWELCFTLSALVAVGENGRVNLRELLAWTLPPKPDPDDVDEVAVDRACRGEAVDLTRAERRAAIDKLNAKGMGSGLIGLLTGCSQRTVVRRRALVRAASTDSSQGQLRETSRETLRPDRTAA